MRILKFSCLLVLTSLSFGQANNTDQSRWDQHAKNVTIIRDDWGIAHVYGKTDADAVFGMVYAQAEDDFNRVEINYINAMGRLAEVEGEAKIYQDLRMKLFVDPENLKRLYGESPAWLKELMVAWADGLNFYLAKHPQVKPRLIKHLEPWMALSFPEGSIGGDIEGVKLRSLEALYGGKPLKGQEPEVSLLMQDEEPRGSNGMAIAPSNTTGHHALLLINPHTSFFFRSELQMVSESGLNAYGAATWGQFFLYQGFNDRVGWMHTTSGVDAVDEYLETVEKRNGKPFYKYGGDWKPVQEKKIVVPYRSGSATAEKTFTAYFTQHGPVIREQNGKWVSVRMMYEPVKALQQSFIRTKARSYKEYLDAMQLKANSSNNTIFADADGDIAYFHGNFIPKRDTKFDWTKPVDGSDPATDWQGLMAVDETPHLLNPKSGWLYNSNNWPWSAAGESSPKRQDYPAYVETGVESARGLHAIRVLSAKKDFTVDSLMAAAYDSYLPWFEVTIPVLGKAWDNAPASDPMKTKLAEPVKALREWDLRWDVKSVPTSLAVYWGTDLRKAAKLDAKASAADFAKLPPSKMLQSLAAASDKLTSDFGTWKTPWGDINRFQRLNDEITPKFYDDQPSTPVGFTSAIWGSLASFGAKQYPNTKKWYGTSGNSFVAVVEFGDKVRARAVTAGGESGDPTSPHFNDEAQRYSTGQLRDVYFYRDQLKGHTTREYHPGS